ncbi:ATP-grasp domain-containing protein [Flavilitoribacter nigricans]|nr:glutathione synthetase [Flavilitoribacter nigricans]
MREHPLCERIDIASRGWEENRAFFSGKSAESLLASPVTEDFAFHPDGIHFRTGLRAIQLQDYDAIFLRLPPPLDNGFLRFLTTHFPNQKIINRPSGLMKTANKAFLLNFPEICPEMKLCENAEDIRTFSKKFPIVLKPLRNYGGKGIVKIQGEQVEVDGQELSLEDFLSSYEQAPEPYLAMKFLKNVNQGDKRIVVVNEQVLGGVLRLPPPGAWLCNAAQGGQATGTELTPEETRMAQVIGPVLQREGIAMFGFDTLVDDQGKRILSEINTLSIGGLPQMGALNGQPVVSRAAALLWQYINDEIYGDPD